MNGGLNTKFLWHNKPFEFAFKELNSSPSGLSIEETTARLKSCGSNIIPEIRKRNSFTLFLKQFHNTLIYVMLSATLITLLLNKFVDAFVILAVVIVNAIIGFIQEDKAEKGMAAIHKMLAPLTTVIRNGERKKIESMFLVPGDIVILEAGDKVTADLRLFSTNNLFIQEAVLTGESVAVEKNANPVIESAMLGDRSCMAYSGTLVTSGQGKGVVIGTGINTEIGGISTVLSQVQSIDTPLVVQMRKFARWLTLSILLIAIVFFLYGYLYNIYSFSEMFMIAVSLAVAAIPEGLPAVITINFAISVQAMVKHNVIVRKLPAIETLGSVSVICTDKTGTLTRNDMVVSSVVIDEHLFTLHGNGYEPKGSISLSNKPIEPSDHIHLIQLAKASALCNDAILKEHNKTWIVEGDPMEGALLSFAGKAGFNILSSNSEYLRADCLPFDAKHRFMATLHHIKNDTGVIFVKGAPERILSMCNMQITSTGNLAPLNKEHWNKQIDIIAALGQRVLAFATKEVSIEQKKLSFTNMESLTFIGLAGMIDPPRPEAISAIAACKMAGIRVKMITGDHAKTACAIGKQIGLQNYHKVLTGHDLDNMTDTKLQEDVLNCDIFARTTPEHKLRLVTALQKNNLTVAMTGDGVNDAPALKRADVGIAMGETGSEVAKESAKLILLDDNFASIEAAVREGRTAYDNIQKVIIWTLPTNAGVAVAIIVAILLGMELPVTPIQILWVNLVTSATLGIALAFEPTEENTMRRPPRARDEPILSSLLIWQIIWVSTLFSGIVIGVYSYAISIGYSVELAHTLCINILVVLEIFYLFFTRNIYGTSFTWKGFLGTRIIWLTLFTITSAQFAITYIPLLQKIFATQAVSFIDGLSVIGIGIIFFIVIEGEKQLSLIIKGKIKTNEKSGT